MTDRVFKIQDRVKRVEGEQSEGTVTMVRAETHGTAAERKERGVIIGVQWDNGTFSYFTPDALVVLS